MVGDVERAKILQFYQSKIASIEATSSRDWWKHMKTLLVNSPGGQNEMLSLANAFTGGDMITPVNRMKILSYLTLGKVNKLLTYISVYLCLQWTKLLK